MKIYTDMCVNNEMWKLGKWIKEKVLVTKWIHSKHKNCKLFEYLAGS